MSSKIIFALCAQVLFIQSAISQCTSRAAVDASGYAAITAPAFAASGWVAPALADPLLASPAWAAPALAAPILAYDGLAYPGAGFGLAYDGIAAPAMEFTTTSGGAFVVTSGSAVPPTGISVVSENAYDGVLVVAGEVPFVGTTGMEGVLPTVGSGAINHACGNGITAMASGATVGPIGTIAPSLAIAPASAIAPIAPITSVAAIAPAAAIAPIAPIPAIAPAAAYSGCGGALLY